MNLSIAVVNSDLKLTHMSLTVITSFQWSCKWPAANHLITLPRCIAPDKAFFQPKYTDIFPYFSTKTHYGYSLEVSQEGRGKICYVSPTPSLWAGGGGDFFLKNHLFVMYFSMKRANSDRGIPAKIWSCEDVQTDLGPVVQSVVRSGPSR